jgi:anti-sigma factor RsiW
MGRDGPDAMGSVTRDPHETYLADLAGYVFGVLDQAEVGAVEEHLGTCDICAAELPRLQATVAQLDEVPPEAFIDGPPEGADLLVQRTLRRIDSARPGPGSGRWRGLAVAAVAGIVTIASAVLIGRETAPNKTAQGFPVVSPSPSPSASVVPGTKVFSATDARTGARLTAQLVPAQGWVRISVAVTGIPEGQRCVLYVVPRHGRPVQAGSWLVSAAGARQGTALQGTALVPADQVAAVTVSNTAGKTFVTAAA